MATGSMTALKERQGADMVGEISTAGNSLLAGLCALGKVIYLVKEPNLVGPCSPRKLFVSV